MQARSSFDLLKNRHILPIRLGVYNHRKKGISHDTSIMNRRQRLGKQGNFLNHRNTYHSHMQNKTLREDFEH
jgi:hypothetical protein